MYLFILLGVICDRDAAKVQRYQLTDLLNKPEENLKDFTVKQMFKIIRETYTYILCGDVADEHNFFNIRKFVLIITTIYADWAMKLKGLEGANYFNLGAIKNLADRNVGHSVMIQDLKIQLAYKLIIKPISQARFRKVKTDREIKFVSCNKEIQTISQNKPIELNDIDGLQQLISLINQVQQLQSQNIPTLEQPDKPKPKPGQPIETEEPEEKPDYDLIYAKIKYNNLVKKIKKKQNVAKLNVNIKDEIDFETKYITEEQKKEFHKIREDPIQQLKGKTKFDNISHNIKNEFFIGNLLDNNNIKNELNNKKLEDRGYYDDRIKEIR
ncbi:hypothetical protein C2G38_2184238 [Gigaspora rosea]|uniref:Uncharacterized protein n=1 Tax=Gigaspora rosea TaxID=44941 RepID=A0A397VA95_9GLOM|nr:hypothetical protein C2G38_2184238 [Gigaspora rosea]